MSGVALRADTDEARKQAARRLKISVFSKHFQWTSWEETATLAAEIGFDGVDLTVRDAGHVLPERVESDLPKAVEVIRKAGIEVPMITTGIIDPRSPHAEAILKTASSLNIRHYRWGGLTYNAVKSIDDQLNDMRPRVKDLWALSKEHNVCGMYHTHSGPGLVGAPIWDVWLLFRDLNPQWIGANYDIGHATVEGGYGGWIASARLLKDHMRGIALKDFKWAKSAEGHTYNDPFGKSVGIKGEWAPDWCAPGEGMVNFSGFFAMVKSSGFAGPIQLHFEYPGLGGANDGGKVLSITKSAFTAIMRRDLGYIKRLMRDAQLV